MRRVFDDTQYNKISKAIDEVLHGIDRDGVSKYEFGCMRSQCSLIMKEIIIAVPDIKWGRNCNTTGIGNNRCYEIIYTGNENEEQIVGLIHLTDNMYGRHICWVSDIDGKRNTESVKI